MVSRVAFALIVASSALVATSSIGPAYAAFCINEMTIRPVTPPPKPPDTPPSTAKVTIQDFHFVKKTDKASAKLN